MICPKCAEGASLTARGKPLRNSFKSHSHKRLTFAFTLEIGYTLVLTHKSAHSGSHAQTGRVSDGGCYHYSRRALRGPEPLRAQRSEEHTLPSLHGPRERRREAESLRDSDALMRVAVPRRRGPAGLRDPVAVPLTALIGFTILLSRIVAHRKLSACSLVTAVRFWNRCLRRSMRETYPLEQRSGCRF